MTKEQIRAFLEQDEIQLLIADEELEEVYSKCDYGERKDLTEYLLSIEVQPDAYMKNIPSAFLRASQISSYDISSTVSVIGQSAFLKCSSLTSITIPDSVTSICSHAFFSCDSLSSIAIPDSVTSIGYCAFYSCKSLTNVTIPKSVTRIGNSAFMYCTGLTIITIPNSVTSIGYEAFDYCGKIEIYYDGTQKQWESISKCAFKGTYYIVHCSDGDVVKRRK